MKIRLFMILAVLVLVTAVGCTKGSDGSPGVPGGSDGAGVTGVTGVPGGSDGSGVPGVTDVTGGNSGETSNQTATGNGEGNDLSDTDGNGQDVAGTNCIITAFAVGKADAILISSGDANILVDAGEEADAEYILAKLKEKGISRLDLLLVTHFDKDHAGGVPQILENIAVDRIYYPDYANTR
ncbi:MAG: MBL fold metallo-hydrolase, partial [Lachnospiraceae bacterium]|nr:MBL fold metallo-hydrolase [Lachnospiraceae bacterium]